MVYLMYLIVPFVTLYFILTPFFGDQLARYYTITTAGVIFIGTLCMAAGLVLIPVFGDYDYFNDIVLVKPVWTAYEAWVWEGHTYRDPPAFGWFLLYPYVAFLNCVLLYFDILIFHFKFHFIFTHGAGLFIIWVWYNILHPDGRVFDRYLQKGRPEKGTHRAVNSRNRFANSSTEEYEGKGEGGWADEIRYEREQEQLRRYRDL